MAAKTQELVRQQTLRNLKEARRLAGRAATAAVRRAGGMIPLERRDAAEGATERWFAFAQELLDTERQFAHDLLHALEPVRRRQATAATQAPASEEQEAATPPAAAAEAVPAPAPSPSPSPAPAATFSFGLQALTVAELDRVAAEREVVDYPSHGTKAEKVAVLEAAEQAAAAQPGAPDRPPEEPEGVGGGA
jgi:hypothetical protein